MSFNLLSARLFGELEFWFSIIKIATIIGLIVVGFVMILFAYKTQFGHASFTNLYEHGVFPKGASGFFMSFQMALFSFVGIEMIVVLRQVKRKILLKQYQKRLIVFLLEF